jgi:uncharacterized membrane protein YfcA
MKLYELPKACPACGEIFNATRRHERRLQKRAILIFLLGIVLSVIVGGLVLSQLPPPRSKVMFLVEVLAALVVSLLPALLVGYVAMCLRKVVTLSCWRCKWSENFKVDHRGT